MTKKEWIDIILKKIDQAMVDRNRSGLNFWIAVTSFIILLNYLFAYLISNWNKLVLNNIITSGLVVFFTLLSIFLLLPNTSNMGFTSLRIVKLKQIPGLGIFLSFFILSLMVPMLSTIYLIKMGIVHIIIGLISIFFLSLLCIQIFLLHLLSYFEIPAFIYRTRLLSRIIFKWVLNLFALASCLFYIFLYLSQLSKNLEINVINLKVAIIFWILIYLFQKAVQFRSHEYFISELREFCDGIIMGTIPEPCIESKYKELTYNLSLRDWLGEKAQVYQELLHKSGQELQGVESSLVELRNIVENQAQKHEILDGSNSTKLNDIFKDINSRLEKIKPVQRKIKRTFKIISFTLIIFHDAVDVSSLKEFKSSVELFLAKHQDILDKVRDSSQKLSKMLSDYKAKMLQSQKINS